MSKHQSKSGSKTHRSRPARRRFPAAVPASMRPAEETKRRALLDEADPQIRELVSEALAKRRTHTLAVVDPTCPLMMGSTDTWLKSLVQRGMSLRRMLRGKLLNADIVEARREAEREVFRVQVGLLPNATILRMLEILRGVIDVDAGLAKLTAALRPGEIRIFSMSGQSFGITPAIVTNSPGVETAEAGYMARLYAVLDAVESDLNDEYLLEEALRRTDHVLLVTDHGAKPAVSLVPVGTLSEAHMLRRPLAADHVHMVVMIGDHEVRVFDHDLSDSLAAVWVKCAFTSEERKEVMIDGKLERCLSSQGCLKFFFYADAERPENDHLREQLCRYQRLARVAVQAESLRLNPRPLGDLLTATFGDSDALFGKRETIGPVDFFERILSPKLRVVASEAP